MAQGNLVVGGAGASAGGSKVQINHLSAGRIPEGATVERAVPTPLAQGDSLQLDLNCERLRHRARGRRARSTRKMGAGIARRARRPRRARAHAGDRPTRASPSWPTSRTSTSSWPTPAAKVVINARTGSIVMNQAVTLAACAVAHGNLSVTINSTPQVSQPGAVLASGQTVVTEKADITITQQAGSLVQMPAGTKLADVVKALNSLGATPQDLLAILQAMKSAGALTAELEVI